MSNLFLAAIAVVFGQSETIKFWFDRSRRIWSRNHRRRLLIVHDQRTLNWYFLSWFSKIVVAVGLISTLPASNFGGGFYMLKFLPEYQYLFILVVIVLYLQTWNSLRLFIKKRSLLKFFVTMVILSLVAFCFSNINLIDYQEINKKVLDKNVYHTYNLKLPQAASFSRIRNQRMLIENIFVGLRHDSISNELVPVIIHENQEYQTTDIPKIIEIARSNRWERYSTRINYLLRIDRNLAMSVINQIRIEFAKCDVVSISIAVVPIEPEYDERIYQDFFLQISTRKVVYDSGLFMEEYIASGLVEHKLVISSIGNHGCDINGQFVPYENLAVVIKSFELDHPFGLIYYYIGDEDIFNNYVRVYSIVTEVLRDIRDDFARQKYGKSYDQLFSDEYYWVKKGFPVRYFEVTEYMLSALE
jgi:hypothetical protein